MTLQLFEWEQNYFLHQKTVPQGEFPWQFNTASVQRMTEQTLKQRTDCNLI